MRRFRQFAEYWAQLSARERRLAIIVATLVVLAGVLISARRALDRIQDLDQQILLVEDGLVSSAQQIKVREAVEAEYQKVAWQHSSAWTEAEILDRLRNEIFRLAQNMPSPLNEEGIAEQVENESGYLIGRPQLGEGSLEQDEEGYREYRIRVRIQDEPFPNFVDYIERLQMSPQSLRIDALELTRRVLDNHVTASLDITRIIVNRRETPWSKVPQGLDAWVNRGCRITRGPAVGAEADEAVVLEPAGPQGAAYLELEVEAGATYEVQFIAKASGNAVVQVYDSSAGANLEGELPLENDGRFHSYRLRFTVAPSGPGAGLRLPFVMLKSADAQVCLAGVSIRKRVA